MGDGPKPPERFADFGAFWPYYLREHAKPATRAVHFLGTGLAVLALLLLFLTGNFWFLLLFVLGGYGPAWIGHFLIEHNRPATFTHPLWSLAADFKMAGLWALGRLEPELARAGVRPYR